MYKNLFSVPRLLVFTIFAITISSTFVRAQTIEPDEQIKLKMLAYLAQTENSLALSRPRVAHQQNIVENPRLDQSPTELKFEPGKTSSLELKAFEILNQERAANNLEPLEWSEDMARVARLHSENMARDKFFSHTGLDGSLVNSRADALGISDWRSIGENIAFNRGFKKPVESACQQWMNSPSHRENILNKKWKASGIGMAVAPDGTYYFTQVFILK